MPVDWRDLIRISGRDVVLLNAIAGVTHCGSANSRFATKPIPIETTLYNIAQTSHMVRNFLSRLYESYLRTNRSGKIRNLLSTGT